MRAIECPPAGDGEVGHPSYLPLYLPFASELLLIVAFNYLARLPLHASLEGQ